MHRNRENNGTTSQCSGKDGCALHTHTHTHHETTNMSSKTSSRGFEFLIKWNIKQSYVQMRAKYDLLLFSSDGICLLLHVSSSVPFCVWGSGASWEGVRGGGGVANTAMLGDAEVKGLGRGGSH